MDQEPNSLAIGCLKNIIWHALDQHLLPTALFTAERLYGMDNASPDTAHLVSLVHYRAQQYNKAASFYTSSIENSSHLGCLYIYALSCFELKEYSKAIFALEKSSSLWENVPASSLSSTNSRLILPTAAMIHALLGKLYRAVESDVKAIRSFAFALRLDPFIWEAVEALCHYGIDLQVSSVYGSITQDVLPKALGDEPPASPEKTTSTPFSFGKQSDSFNFNPSTFIGRPTARTRQKQPPQPTTPAMGTNQTPKFLFGSGSTPIITPMKDNPDQAFTTPTESRASAARALQNAPTRRGTRAVQGGSASLSLSSSSAINSTTEFAPRRSTRQAAEVAKKNISASSSSRFGLNANGNANSKPAFAMGPPTTVPGLKSKPLNKQTKNTNDQMVDEALAFLINMYTLFAKACLHFCKYDCAAALTILEDLPESQKQTPWALAKYARIHFEKVEYAKSLEYFEALRAADRFRIEDMDYYSTLLWHLHKDYELSHLAYDLSNFARNKYQTWCAIGNACSLQHETDAALRCFRRASQVDPSAPYPYTLQAHEYVANDSYEHAQDSYRLALKADKLHYNAWYGLGMVFLRLGNTNMAEVHFRRAAAINPINVVLICCIGMVLEKRGLNEEALTQYSRATAMQPSSAMSRYKRARLLVKLRRFDEALRELRVLATLATDEASVFFLLGQVYKLLGEKEDAVKAFTVALNLDPKGSQMIEEALESLGYEMGGAGNTGASSGGGGGAVQPNPAIIVS